MIDPGRKKWFALALILAVQFMTILDIAIVNVALPSIQLDLGFSQGNLQWVISAYALVFGGFLLLGGRSADLLGRRRVFMFGTIVFTVGSLLCGLAWSEASLIGARALQGLGAATLTPAALSILVAMFAEGRERNIALGAWGAVGGVGAAAGVLFGGILVLSSLGAYSLNRSLLDLAILYAVGAIGCAMRAYDVPLVPAVLGLVLGPLSELQFRRAVAISEGDLSVFLTRPISAALLLVAGLVVLAPRLLPPAMRPPPQEPD